MTKNGTRQGSGSVFCHPTPHRNWQYELYGGLEGKSSLMIYEQFGNLKFKYKGRKFWCRGYYVDTVGKNKEKIAEYI